jgi:hypothetical protein
MMKSRRLRWEEHVASTGKKRNAYRILTGKPEGKRQLGRRKGRKEDNTCIKKYLREIGWGWYGLN